MARKTMGGKPRGSVAFDDVADAPIGKRVVVACEGSRTVPLGELTELQGELKSLSKEDFAKLKAEILGTGMAFPIRVWQDRSSGKEYIVGGHQTTRVLRELEHEGYEIPLVPVTDIMADDMSAAKRRVLQDASQYGEIDRQGLYQFMIDSDIDMGDLAASFRLPDLNIPSFGAEFFMDDVTGKIDGVETPEKKAAEGVKEYGEEEFSEFKHECPRCGFHFD